MKWSPPNKYKNTFLHSEQQASRISGDALQSLMFLLAYGYYLLNAPLMLGFDGYWHIWAGQEILAQGALPYQNLWGVDDTAAWYNLSWLFDVAIAAIYRAGGEPAVIAATAAAGAALIVALYRYIRKQGAGINAAFICVFLCMFLLSSGILARPQLASYWGTFLCVVLIRHAVLKPHFLWLVPIGFCIWANMHGGVLVGLGLLGFRAGYAIWLYGVHQHQDAAIARWIGVVLLSAIAMLITPYGADVFIGMGKTLDSPITAHIGEWRTPGIDEGWFARIYMLCVLLLGWRHYRSNGYHPAWLRDAALVIISSAAAVFSARHVPLMAIITAPIVAQWLDAMAKGWRGWQQREASYTTDMQKPVVRWGAGISALLISLVLVLYIPAFQQLAFNLQSASVQSVRVPSIVAALEPDNTEVRLMNHYNVGGYILYASQGRVPVFIDGRAETAYSRARIEEVIAIIEEESTFITALGAHGITHIVWPLDSRYRTWLDASPEWHAVLQEKTYGLWKRSAK